MSELFVLPLNESEYLVYAPLRGAALIANAALVRFLQSPDAGERTGDVSAEVLAWLRKAGIVGGAVERAPVTQLTGPPRPHSSTHTAGCRRWSEAA